MDKPAASRSTALATLRALGYNRVPRATALLRGKARTVQQVVQQSSGLAELAARAEEGRARLKAIAELLPPSLRASVQSGTVEHDAWCLLVPHAAAAAKLRQMLPALAAHLRSRGWPVQQLRVKIKTQR
jgi:hypothetical protein